MMTLIKTRKELSEELMSLIGKYPLVTVIPDRAIVLKTPKEIREEANRDVIDSDGKFIEKKYSPERMKHFLEKADKGESVTLIERGRIFVNHGNIDKIRRHIVNRWRIMEIINVKSYLHRGIFQSPAGWGYEQYGIVTQTREEDTELARLFDGLLSDCHTNMGAAAILSMHNSRFLSGYAITNWGNGPHVHELTLAELSAEIPDEYRKKLDLIRAVTLAARTAGASAKDAVEHTLPKVYIQTANMSDDELRDAAKPKRRRKGGGRKQARDIGNRQVKAVIALSPASHRRPIMECCAEVIRKGGDFENPYKTSKDLAAAVRRFGERTGKSLTFRTQFRAWSEKS